MREKQNEQRKKKNILCVNVYKERRGRVCWSATFILCCARKNVNYSKVRTAITYHLTIPNKQQYVQEATSKKEKKNIADIMK